MVHTNLYDPKINEAYNALARHYGVAIIPARVRKPRDKASVESGVGWLETWLLEWLKGKIYYSFTALNHDIKERLRDLVKVDFKHRPGSRESNFIAIDKPMLRQLPKDRFEAFTTRKVNKVSNNYHVKFADFYYSVPYTYYKKSVVIHAYAKKIEIFDAIGNRIAYHERRYAGQRYVTATEHMPANHQAIAEFNGMNGAYYKQRAFKIGSNTYNFVDKLLASYEFEEQAYKSCVAIINFSRTYGDTRVDRACEKALKLNSVTYTTLKNILKNGQDSLPIKQSSSDADTPTPYHENLRTGEWM